MKKIISFVVLAAMLVAMIVPATVAAADVAVLTPADASVLEGDASVSTSITFEAPAAVAEFGGILFWSADFDVEEVILTVDGEVFDTENSGLGTILAGNNRAVKNDLAAFGANTAAFKACTVDFLALDAVESAEATLTFVFAEPLAVGENFSFSAATLYADNEDVAEDAASAVITILKDPYMGLYSDPTLFIVSEDDTVEPGAQVKADVRIDANPGINTALYILVYPEGWTVESSTCGKVFASSCYTPGTPDLSVAENTAYLKDRLACYPDTPLEGNSYITAFFQMDDPMAVNENNGILASYVFNVPEDAAPASTADLTIIYDKEGDIIKADAPGEFTYWDLDVVGKTFTIAGEPAPSCDHKNTTDVIVTPATCTETGVKNVVCADCEEVLQTGVVIEALGHDYQPGETVAATCTEGGYTPYTCTRCKDTENRDATEELGHDYKVTASVAASCTEGGYTEYTCSRCKDSYKDRTFPLGHTSTPYAEVSATCTESGFTGGTYCSVCNETLTERTVVPALGHSWDNGEITTQPTEETAGEKTFHCTRCDATRTEPVAPLDHTHNFVLSETVKATCTEGGYELYACTCGETEKRNETPALGHNYETVTTPATCEEAGSIAKTCANCGDKIEETIPALGHQAGSWEVIQEPTEEANGIRVKKCVRCGEEMAREEISALSFIKKVSARANVSSAVLDGENIEITSKKNADYVIFTVVRDASKRVSLQNAASAGAGANFTYIKVQYPQTQAVVTVTDKEGNKKDYSVTVNWSNMYYYSMGPGHTAESAVEEDGVITVVAEPNQSNASFYFRMPAGNTYEAPEGLEVVLSDGKVYLKAAADAETDTYKFTIKAANGAEKEYTVNYVFANKLELLGVSGAGMIKNGGTIEFIDETGTVNITVSAEYKYAAFRFKYANAGGVAVANDDNAYIKHGTQNSFDYVCIDKPAEGNTVSTTVTVSNEALGASRVINVNVTFVD